MSTVAFLASVVDPRVAASATKAAIEEFAKMKDEVLRSVVSMLVFQVPPLMVEAYTKNVEALQELKGAPVDGSVGLAKSGIADNVEKKEDGEKSEGNDGEGASSGATREGAKEAVSESVQTAAAAALAAAAVKAKVWIETLAENIVCSIWLRLKNVASSLS